MKVSNRNRFPLFTLALTLLAYATVSQAHIIHGNPPPAPPLANNPPQLASASVVKTEALSSPLITTNDRAREVFHWDQRQTVSSQVAVPASWPAQDPSLDQYIKSQIATFGSQAVSETAEIGLGLYTAVDPISSASFGGVTAQAVLFRIGVRAGARILTLGQNTVLSGQVLDELRAVGCNNVATLDDVFGMSGDDLSCRRVTQALVRDLQIDAVAYAYNALTLPGFTPGFLAILLVSADALAPGSVTAFVDQAYSDAALRQEIGLYKMMQSQNATFSSGLVSALSGDAPTSAQFQDWVLNDLFFYKVAGTR